MEYISHPSPQEELETVPSFETIYQMVRYMPTAGAEFNLFDTAEDCDVTPQRFLAILECLARLGHHSYTQNGDMFMIVRKERGKITEVNYRRTYCLEDTDESCGDGSSPYEYSI